MFNKADFMSSLHQESKLLKHLVSKVREDDLKYRPSEGQRSMRELIEYLSMCAIGPIAGLLDGWEALEPLQKKAAAMPLSEFGQHFDEQIEAVADRLSSMDDDALRSTEVTFPWGTTAPLSTALVEWPLKFLAAYRMQLFLYLKACGQSELGTADCWMGASAPGQ